MTSKLIQEQVQCIAQSIFFAPGQVDTLGIARRWVANGCETSDRLVPPPDNSMQLRPRAACHDHYQRPWCDHRPAAEVRGKVF